MTEAELAKIAADQSMSVTLTLKVDINNRAITPAQRRTLHQMMVKAAKRMGSQLALGVEDHRAVKLSCERASSHTGKMQINLAEDPVDEE
jgi:hypothetical protein